MENMSPKKLTLLAALLLLVAGALYLLVQNSNETAELQEAERQEAQSQASIEEPTDNSQFDDPEDVEEPEPDDPQKQPVQSQTVLETPAVYTSFGHTEANPLPSGQATSTSCTTDSNVECYIVFSNGDEQITFDIKTTDSDGGAVWSWTGGEDVPSGTWQVTAVAGDKTSAEETIYIN